MKIYVENRVGLPTAEVRKVIKAVNKQLKEHFFPAWSISARLVYRAKTTAAPDKSKDALIILAPIDVSGALGYHDWSPEGIPFGIVDPAISAELYEAWSVTLSHEAMELALDTCCNLYAKGPHPVTRKTVLHWLEASDACQADTYEIDGVRVSEFLLPDYFTTQNEGRNTTSRGFQLASFGVRPGGYVGYFDPATGKEGTYMIEGDVTAKKRWEIKQRIGAMRRAGKRASE